VAMTRAMKQLTMTFAQGRMLWGSIKYNGPSQFLYEIPSEYYNWGFFQTGSNKKSSPSEYTNPSYDDFNQASYSDDFDAEKVFQRKQTIAKLSNYPSGSKIIHSLYGEGTVLDSEGLGQDEKVTIQFRDGIKKKFMVKFAPLQKV
jgi:DNA helicase-2/ATP-dependent DNA helicase PcrA